MDIGLALIAAVLAHTLFGLPLAPHLIVVCLIFILVVDIDCLLRITKHGWVPGFGHEHRDILHWPLVYVPVGSIVVGYLAGWQFGTLFFTLSLAHFIHDSIGTGWGVAWLRPFSRRYYKFLSLQHGDASFTLKNFVASWTPDEQHEAASKYGNPNWIRDMYIYPIERYRKMLVVEVIVLVGGLALLASYLW